MTLEPLLATTPRSWMRSDMSATSGTRAGSDAPGPIPMAYAASRTSSGSDDARVVVVGNSTFVNNNQLDAYANRDFFLKFFNKQSNLIV